MNKANGAVDRIAIALGIGLLAGLTGCIGVVGDGGDYYGGDVEVGPEPELEPGLILFGADFDRRRDEHVVIRRDEHEVDRREEHKSVTREEHDFSRRGSESRTSAHHETREAPSHETGGATHPSGGGHETEKGR